MEKLLRSAIIIELIDKLNKAGSWTGETHIQKSTFFLQEFNKVPLNYDFILYKYGPYSFELSDDLAFLRADEYLELIPSPPYGASYQVRDRKSILSKFFKKEIEPFSKKIDTIATNIGIKQVTELEKLATILYIEKKLGIIKKEDVVAKVTELKPHIVRSEASSAFSDFNTLIKSL